MAKPIHTRIRVSVLSAAALVSTDAFAHSATLPQQLPSWCAAGPPELRTAADDVLSGVAGAHRFEHGGIVVASAGTHELRFYDVEGRYVRSAGRQGDGPGEFRQLALLRSFGGDSLFTFDGGQGRASVFGPTGELARTFRMPDADGFVIAADVFADGRVAAVVREGFQSDQAVTGVHRRTVRLLELDRSGRIRTDLGVFPGDESYVLSQGGSMIAGPLVFGASLHAAALGDGVVVGITDEVHLRRLDPSGLETRLSLEAAGFRRLPVTEADFRLVVDQYLEGFPPDARSIERRRFDEMPRLERLPAFAELKVDPAGHIWIRHESRPGEARREWTVFDAAGAPIARVHAPDGSRVLEIGRDRVVVSVTDEFGVERVEVHAIEREGIEEC